MDFVFLDDARKAYRVKTWEGEPWLFYWHAANKWVSLRKIASSEIAELELRKLSAEQAALYNYHTG